MSKQEELINNYTNLDLEILPNIIRKNNFDYELIKREPSKCLYAQKSNGLLIAYEVFKTKIIVCRDALIKMKEKTGRGNNPELRKEYKETFPVDEDFGKRAWTYPNLELAEKRYICL